MTKERYKYLMWDNFPDAKLTDEEIKEGWHFCPDWDGLLIGKDSPEAKCCYCFGDK